MKSVTLKVIAGTIALVLLSVMAGIGVPQSDPISKEALVNALKELRRGDSQVVIEKEVRARGVDFALTKQIEAELRRAGARAGLIVAVRNGFRRQLRESIGSVFEPGLMKVRLNPTRKGGTISGRIDYLGSGRTLKIDTSADEVCGQMNPKFMSEDIVVKDGKLANVFVYIKDGLTADGKKLSDLRFGVPISEVVLDQQGCRFVPHVLGVQVNQKLKITNSDPTFHNVHFTPRNNPDWSQSLPNGGPPIEHRFTQREVMLPVKNNQHPWMKAYIGVLTHPFYAVTGSDGSFKIGGIPPGTYTLVAWHEGAGTGSEVTIEVTVE